MTESHYAAIAATDAREPLQYLRRPPTAPYKPQDLGRGSRGSQTYTGEDQPPSPPVSESELIN
jgi:hypothetical protein